MRFPSTETDLITGCHLSNKMSNTAWSKLLTLLLNRKTKWYFDLEQYFMSQTVPSVHLFKYVKMIYLYEMTVWLTEALWTEHLWHLYSYAGYWHLSQFKFWFTISLWIMILHDSTWIQSHVSVGAVFLGYIHCQLKLWTYTLIKIFIFTVWMDSKQLH